MKNITWDENINRKATLEYHMNFFVISQEAIMISNKEIAHRSKCCDIVRKRIFFNVHINAWSLITMGDFWDIQVRLRRKWLNPADISKSFNKELATNKTITEIYSLTHVKTAPTTNKDPNSHPIDCSNCVAFLQPWQNKKRQHLSARSSNPS